MLGVVKKKSVRRAEYSSRGVLPIVLCLSAIMNPRKWGALGPLGLLGHAKNKDEVAWDIRPRSELSSIAWYVEQRLRYCASEKTHYENFVVYFKGGVAC